MIETTRMLDLLTTMTQRIEEFDPSAAQRLTFLRSALEDESSAEMNAWADSDPLAIVQPEVVLAQYHSYLTQNTRSGRDIAFWAKPLRIFLLCLPVLLTGTGLLRALQLYPSILSSSIHNASGSLLYWWQQGFNGQLPSWLRIGPLVVVDLIFVLAFLLFSCWLVLGPAQRLQRQQQEQLRQEQELRSDLTHLLALVSLYLAQFKSQLTVADNLTVVVRRIDTMSRRLDAHFERITGDFADMTQRVSQHFERITGDFADMTQHTSEHFSLLSQDLTQDLDNMARDMTNKYDAMSQQVMKYFRQVADQMLEQSIEGSKYLKEMGDLTSGIVQTAAHVDHATNLLKETNSQLTFQLEELVTPMVELTQQQEMLNISASQATRLLTDTAQTMAQLGRQQERWGTDLRNMLDGLDLSNERTTEVALKLATLASHQDAFLTRLQQDQQQLIELLSRPSEHAL
ncbi:hypothetical protein [Dictyobacter arantiisoli]|uniref:Uncharacterized protein n=1 Tax=Dictyobacter arantiisoli TaxID=2014874 RepID=A0A5A5TG63_9CHLR|nr:hypothetical protein [Dictyobacter arantiisoli]GCF10248.1 hypothetical protein KDI_38120 [Dictyobacter arantiisoli]